MALLLIKDRDHTHPDPVKDLRGCYKRGDIIEVLDDSAHDGDLVTNPIAAPFLLVRILNTTKEQVEKYIQSQIDNEVIVRRRLYRIRVDDVPNSIKNKLRDDRYVEVTRNQIINFIRNKATNLDES